MPIQEEIYGLDLLVYSSHKTATQTLVHTLADHGYRSLHCHTLANVTTRLTPELQQRFLADLERGELPGKLESIQEFCEAMAIPVAQLRFDPGLQWGVNAFADCRLHLFRFDSLMGGTRLQNLLTMVAGRPIRPTPANLSAAKWYSPILGEFRASLRLPAALIRRVYQERADLLRLMYQEGVNSLLENTLARFAQSAA
jgi:hypothetical protein